MGAEDARPRGGPGPLLWPLLLLLLLPLSPEAASAPQPSTPGRPQAPKATRATPWAQEAGEPSAGGAQEMGHRESSSGSNLPQVGQHHPSCPDPLSLEHLGEVEEEQPLRGRGLEQLAVVTMTKTFSSYLGKAGVKSSQLCLAVQSLVVDAEGRGVHWVCGKAKVVGKVSGGQDAVAGQWPWQASLLFRGAHLCGAVLIDSQWLVSTAHCFLNKSKAPENYEVQLGYTQLYHQTQHTVDRPVNRIITHPDFEKFHPFGSDIAMLQLRLPVNFTSYVTPACLPPTDAPLPSYAPCWITGWGKLSEDVRLLPSSPLQEGKVGLIENKLCNSLFTQRSGQSEDYVHKEMLCAGNFSSGKAICRGDSGGPLVCFHPRAWVLMGLASWGLACQHTVYPSVFTRVSYFRDWISQTRRLPPPRDPVTTPPPEDTPSQAVRAAGPPPPCATLAPLQTWFLLLFILKALQQALG